MTAVAQKLTDEVLRLPRADRDALVEQLLLSLDEPAQEEIDRLWIATAERRLREIEDGKVAPLDGEEVFAKLRARLGQ